MEERVKICLECETILPFDAEVCSLCGTRCLRKPGDEEAVKPCLACEALIPASDLFCPVCGDFTLTVRAEGRTLAPLGAREGGLSVLLARIAAVAIAAGGLALAVTALLDWIGIARS